MGVLNAFSIIRHLGRMVKADMDLPDVHLEIDDKNKNVTTAYLLQYGHNIHKVERKSVTFDITVVEAMNRGINGNCAQKA